LTRQRVTVRVRNEAFSLAPVNLKAKQQVAGVLPVEALFTGMPPSRVLLYLDGKQIDHDTSPPTSRTAVRTRHRPRRSPRVDPWVTLPRWPWDLRRPGRPRR